MGRVEVQLRLIADALRRGDGEAARVEERRLDACILESFRPHSGAAPAYTPGVAGQLAELARLSDERGPGRGGAAERFASAVARLTYLTYAGPEVRLRVAQDAAVAK